MENVAAENTTLWKRIFESPAVRKMEDDLLKEEIAEREKQIASIRTELAESAKRIAKLEENSQRSLARLKAAQEKMKAAEDERRKALFEKMTASANSTRMILWLEAQLRKSASPEIDAFITEMKTQMETICRRGPATLERKGIENPFTGNRPNLIDSNVASISATLKAMRAAVVEAENLKLTEPDNSKVPAKLAALRAGIPRIEPLSFEALR